MAPANSPSDNTRATTLWDWGLTGAGILALYLPTIHDLFVTVWNTDAQGHGPIILAVTVWLLYDRWPRDIPAQAATQIAAPWALIVVASLTFALGRSQGLLFFEAGSLVMMLTGAIWLHGGANMVKRLWFPLFFLCFFVPLPPAVIDTLTQPMKLAVSWVAEVVLSNAGLPVARSGVILQVGQYQLLVADACAGMQTLFTLEAMGLLYLNVIRHSSAIRNITLAILIIPISFIANVIRVIALILITYQWGDEAGQGFLHGFAGMVLFMSSLILIMAVDTALRRFVAYRIGDAHALATAEDHV